MIDMKQMIGATSYGEDEIVIVIRGEFWGPFTLDEAKEILSGLKETKARRRNK